MEGRQPLALERPCLCGRGGLHEPEVHEWADKIGDRPSDYRLARIGAMSALTLLVCILAVIDAWQSTYSLEPLTLFAVLATILGLAGLEANDLIRGGK